MRGRVCARVMCVRGRVRDVVHLSCVTRPCCGPSLQEHYVGRGVYVSVRVYVCVCTYAGVCVFECLCACVCVCMHMCVCVSVCAYVRALVLCVYV